MPRLIFHPTKEDFEYLLSWAEREEKKAKACNFGLVHDLRRGIRDKRPFIVLRVDGKAEAFMIYYISEKVYCCEVIYLNPAFQGRGLGKLFQTKVDEHFRKKGYLVSKIYEPTHIGLAMIKKMGYTPMVNDYDDAQLYWTKPLIAYRKEDWTAPVRLVLWRGCPDDCKEYSSWSLDSDAPEPILAYGSPDWHIGVKVNDTLVFEDKMKYFYDRFYVFEENFLYLPPSKIQAIVAKYVKP